ncbi:nucleoporin nup188 homolog, partial [Plakobranchus ocellatus]
MAGAGVDSFGNQLLWQTISGTGFLRPPNVVEHELNKNQEKLLQGLSYYKKQKTPAGEALKSRKLKQDQHDFILKLNQFLGLDELQSHDLFCSYLFTEYKGSQKELTHILNHERSCQALLLKIQDFYHGERLYLLRCLRHILHCWLQGEHAYKNIFIEFLNKILDQNLLGKKLLLQFEEACSAPMPTKDINGPLMGRAQVLLWAHQNLREQVELLELLLVYYKDFEMDLPTVLDLFTKFKKHGFGWGQSYKHLVDGPMEKLVQRIGHLELLLLLEGLDVMNAIEVNQQNNLSEHAILGDRSGLEKMASAMSQLGSEPIHGPLLLAWSVLQYIRGEAEQASRATAEAADSLTPEQGKTGNLVRVAQRVGNQALQLKVFDFLMDMLDTEPFCGQSDLASIAHYLVYSMFLALLSFYHEDSLGNTE